MGAYLHDVSGADSGAVYVFQRNEGGENNWGQVAKLVSADIAAGDWFGRTVLLDGSTLLVGAQHGANNPGAVYVFSGGGSNWTQTHKLTVSDGKSNSLGTGLNWDGTRIIAGAQYDDDKAQDAGAAYVFIPEPSAATLLGIAAGVLLLSAFAGKRK